MLDAPEEIRLSDAGKFNNKVKEVIASSSEAMKFLNELKQMKLTTEEGNQLLLKAKNLCKYD